jgi:hypothetical protein
MSPLLRERGRPRRTGLPGFYASRARREIPALAIAVALAASAGAAHAQTSPAPARSFVVTRTGSWKRFAAGFAASILAHEAGHVAASLLLGHHPSFGLDHGRPTVYSGIDWRQHPHQQFLFASAGLDVQTLLDEAVLDTPHDRGDTFERGILAGGIATTGFYLTVGRSGSVSDVAYMVRTSRLSYAQVAMIYGGVALLQLVRIERDGHYAQFFVHPDARATLRIGVTVR